MINEIEIYFFNFFSTVKIDDMYFFSISGSMLYFYTLKEIPYKYYHYYTYLPRMDIVKGNWLEVLDEHVHDDLRKHRTYKGHSVRDLLRALRNKKHHYNELPDVTKLMYGRIPDQYCVYWTSRFPQLVTHSWMAMHQIKNEPNLAKYFDKDYDFVKVRLLFKKQQHINYYLSISYNGFISVFLLNTFLIIVC